MVTSSQKEFSLIVDGQTYSVKIQELAGGDLEIEVDGNLHRVSMAEATGQEAPSAAQKAAPIPPPLPSQPSTPASRPTAAGTGQVTAPMPGDIVQISVKIGDPVSIGQEVCVLEAMKMKNVLRASTPGVVKSIEVSSGQSVKYGDVLVRLEN